MKNKTIYSIVRIPNDLGYTFTILDSWEEYELAEHSKWRWEQYFLEKNMTMFTVAIQASVLHET